MSIQVKQDLSNCIIEQMSLSGRVINNVCDGTSTILPYTLGDYFIGGMLGTIGLVMLFVFIIMFFVTFVTSRF